MQTVAPAKIDKPNFAERLPFSADSDFYSHPMQSLAGKRSGRNSSANIHDEFLPCLNKETPATVTKVTVAGVLVYDQFSVPCKPISSA